MNNQHNLLKYIISPYFKTTSTVFDIVIFFLQWGFILIWLVECRNGPQFEHVWNVGPIQGKNLFAEIRYLKHNYTFL